MPRCWAIFSIANARAAFCFETAVYPPVSQLSCSARHRHTKPLANRASYRSSLPCRPGTKSRIRPLDSYRLSPNGHSTAWQRRQMTHLSWQSHFRQKTIPHRCRPTGRWFPGLSVGQTLVNQRILLSTCAALTGGRPHWLRSCAACWPFRIGIIRACSL